MKQLVMGLLIGILFLTACGGTSPATTPDIPPTISPSKTPLPSLTPKATFTPEPTATFTETPVSFDMSKYVVYNADGSVNLTEYGTVMLNFDSYNSVPQMQDLGKAFNAPLYSKKLMREWERVLETTIVNGASLVSPFPPNVCTNVTWKADDYGDFKTLHMYNIDPSKPCTLGATPMRGVAMMADNNFLIQGIDGNTYRAPLYIVSFQLWDPNRGKAVWRHFVRFQSGAPKPVKIYYEGQYYIPMFSFIQGKNTEVYDTIIKAISAMQSSDTENAMNPVISDEAFNGPLGIYDPRLDGMVSFGMVSSFQIQR